MFSPVYDALSALPKPDFPETLFTRYVPGVTPLSTYKEVCLALAGYLAIIFTAQSYMNNRKAFSTSLCLPRFGLRSSRR